MICKADELSTQELEDSFQGFARVIRLKINVFASHVQAATWDGFFIIGFGTTHMCKLLFQTSGIATPAWTLSTILDGV